jgi:hypothetical protein
MTAPLNISSDLARVTDALEAVVLRRRGDGPEKPGTRIEHALRRVVTTREAAASDGHYTSSDVTWHLPAAEFPEPPRLGDLVCDADGRRWTVLDVAHTTLGSRWRCTSRSLALVHGLDDTISVLAPVYSKGDGGAMEPAWKIGKTGIRARIQPVASQPGVGIQAQQLITRYQVFVEETLTLDTMYRIRGPEGTIYKVLGTTHAEQIDSLEIIDVEVTPWP